MFTTLDTNNDGLISISEFKTGNQGRGFSEAFITSQFNLVDTNADGNISKTEMLNFMKKKVPSATEMWHHQADEDTQFWHHQTEEQTQE